MADTPLLIAGLGNPGAEYARNRHNAGFMALDTIHASYTFAPWRSRFHGAISEGAFAGRKTFLLKPATYMNDSGRSLGEAVHFFKLPLSAVIVIHDEITALGNIGASNQGQREALRMTGIIIAVAALDAEA